MARRLPKIGDTVVFAQRYFSFDPRTSLREWSGKVKKVLDDGEHVMVEFKRKPGVDCEVLIFDLLPMDDTGETSVYDETVPYEDVELVDDHDLGGMNQKQLIAEKLQAQEYDPDLDKSITAILI